MEMLLPALAIGGLSFGPYIGYLAYRNHEQYRLIAGTETTPARDVDPESTVEVAGHVAEDARTFASPVSETPCVLCAWRVDTWSERGEMSIWRPTAVGVTSVPFPLADDTGRQPIEIGDYARDVTSLRNMVGLFTSGTDAVKVGISFDGVTVDMTSWYAREEVAPDEEPPDSIAEFVASTEVVDPASGSITNLVDVGNKHGRRRYREAFLRPGDSLYVHGTTDAEGVLTADAGDVTLGDGDEEAVVARKRTRARRGGAAGVGAVGMGLGALALML